LGDRTFTTRKSPVKVKLANNTVLTAVTALSAGDSHVCAVSATKVWCWGLNSKGQLGIGTTTSKNAATVVSKPALLTPKNITCAGYETLLFGTSTAAPKQPVYAWGNNDKGQLGDGTTTTRTSPVALTDLRGLSPHT
jgi:alpha-tubulin suppressor-like RCC1 family protein